MTRPDREDLAEKRWNCVSTTSSPRRDFLKSSSICSDFGGSKMVSAVNSESDRKTFVTKHLLG